MTKEMMEDLLHAITLLLEDLKDVQIKSHQIDELYTLLENKANNVELDINGLEQNVKNLDNQLAILMECHQEKGTNNLIVQSIMN
ncbi:hypothetical protein CIL03_11140 [Virgibacillus indicus]|uniref:Uncharacterized protein n=1 Tax=Virgibacillus indicus TaxID=2024554 RepID=A0A265NAJ5_9BACI|nr:hypothetical protein [Virgibacillus indicus]OZU88831.1 hypothetical protein CIL03_11140 [Virgibacillus indicus]